MLLHRFMENAQQEVKDSEEEAALIKKLSYTNIILVFIIFALLFIMAYQEYRGSKTYEIEAKQRIKFINIILLDREKGLKVFENLVLLDIEALGEGLITIDDKGYRNECLSWSQDVKEKYIALLENSSQKFVTKNSFRKNFFKGLETLDLKCKNKK